MDFGVLLGLLFFGITICLVTSFYGESLVLLKTVFFTFSANAQPFLNRRFRLNRLSSPPILDPGIGTEDAPL